MRPPVVVMVQQTHLDCWERAMPSENSTPGKWHQFRKEVSSNDWW
jgi:hypothetical protein